LFAIFAINHIIKEYAMKTTLQVEGMTCDHCVKHVTEALEEVDGVSAAAVSLKEKTAVVEHGEGVSLAALKAAVVEAGYETA
jgi:copper ion binding protein